MTQTDDTLSRLEVVLDRLERLAPREPVAPSPLAAGDLPAHVASGELIAAVWGNGVVDELLRLRNERFGVWTHVGVSNQPIGAYDLGTTVLAAQTYPQHVTVNAVIRFGFATGQSRATAVLTRFSDSGNLTQPEAWANTSTWTYVPISWAWTVAPGAAASFKTTINFTAITTGGGYAAANGTYHVQRYGSP